eukprot:m.86381 g.86381  ORF g.86381 m.86381 type:complete len:153 (-) comp8757_c3_seq3:507-965(-)
MGRRESTDILSSNEVDRIQRSSLERINKSGRSLYDVLCCNQEDDDLALKTSYRKLVRKLHPDRNRGEDTSMEFENVQCAYKILKNNETRRVYDKMGFDGLYVAEVIQRDGDIDEDDWNICSSASVMELQRNYLVCDCIACMKKLSKKQKWKS